MAAKNEDVAGMEVACVSGSGVAAFITHVALEEEQELVFVTIAYYYSTCKKRGAPSKKTPLKCRVRLQSSAGALLFTDAHMNRLVGCACLNNPPGPCDPILRDFHGDRCHGLDLLSISRAFSGNTFSNCLLPSDRAASNGCRSLCDPSIA